MATKPLEVQLLEVFHAVDLDTYSSCAVKKEEIYPRFSGVWRGVEIRIEATMSRSVFGANMSEWRFTDFSVRAWRDAYSFHSAGFYEGVSDIARRRFWEACEPVALAYTTSDDYAKTYKGAIVRAIREQASERFEPAHKIRIMTAKWAHEIGAQNCAQLEQLAQRLDAVSESVAALTVEGATKTVYVESSRHEKVTA